MASTSAAPPIAFEDFFERLQASRDAQELPDPVIPSLLPYFRSPTFANARALLNDLSLPVPYEDLRRVAESDRALAKARSRSRRGGASPEPSGPSDFFALHRRLDFLHDLRGIDVSREGLARILRDTHVPPELRVALRKIAQTSRGRRNVELGKLAEGLAGIRAALLSFVMTPNARVAYADATLKVRFSEWLERPELEIVLDGIFKTPIPVADDPTTLSALNSPDGDGARSLALCAFLQLVIGDCPRTAPSPPGVKTIRFLVGDFQTMDVKGANQFVRRWVDHLRTESPYLRGLAPAAVTTSPLWAKDLPSLAGSPFADVAVARNGLRVAAGAAPLWVPYRPPADARELNEAMLPDTPDEFLAKYRRYFHTSMPKRALEQLFRDYQDTAIANAAPPGSATDRLIGAAIAVNGFRDALKAEVALARGAVYITLDNLALVYYAARAEQLGAPRQGLMIRATGPKELVYKAYVPDIFPEELHAQMRAMRAAPSAPQGI